MFKGKKILLVDDNEANQMLAKIILERHGAETVIAWNGKEAVEKMTAHYFDLVLMDIQMPVMDGFEATIAIRKTNQVTPIVALTANTLSGEEEKCRSIGMNGFLAKPFKEQALIRLLAEALNILADADVDSVPGSNLPVTKSYKLDNLQLISDGNEAFMNMMIEIFVTDVNETIAGFDEAIAKLDFDTIKALAHRIKPTLETFGVAFYQQIRRIEVLSQHPQNDNELAALIKLFKAHLSEVLLEMKDNKNF